MSSSPKDEPLRPIAEDPYGPGQMDDGSIDTFPPSELPARAAARDAEEAAFADFGDPDGFEDDPDDLSDLDDGDDDA